MPRYLCVCSGDAGTICIDKDVVIAIGKKVKDAKGFKKTLKKAVKKAVKKHLAKMEM